MALADVVPLPREVYPDPAGDFTVDAGTAVRPGPLAHLLGLPVAADGRIALLLDGEGPPEGYRLEITAAGVTLRAAAPAGLFHGVQTLRQLLPSGTLPGGRIVDFPRYAYRGAMLDLARFFLRPGDVKRHLDTLAAFKINHLHLHLTDDQGWRLAIDGWPRLAEIGGGPGTGVDGAGPGHLTAEDYTDLIAYAAERFITVVPEIDMPGHVNAALVAYPELTADGVAPPPRTDMEVGHSSLVTDREITYRFAEDVIRVVAGLTPGPYLHVGGDEAWSTTGEQYRAFLDRVLPMVAAHGKQAIGWHDVATAPVLQFWRDEPDPGLVPRAAAAGRKVIMSPADRVYLDMKYDADTRLGLDWAGHLGVRRAYEWDPLTRLPGLTEEAVLGVEAPLWSETVRSLADLQYLTFPRLPAVAEVAWSDRSARDWESFRRRLAAFGPRWTAAGVAFHRSAEIDWPDGSTDA